MKDLSARQQRILDYIREFIEEHDYPPSIQQIQQACDISSTSVVDYNLRILERQGHIRRDRSPRVVHVPIRGTIAAGPLNLADESTADMTESIEVVPEMIGDRENVFALRVKGTSMIDALVNDGDVVILEGPEAARDGDMVVAWLKNEEETTLKRIFREGDRVRL